MLGSSSIDSHARMIAPCISGIKVRPDHGENRHDNRPAQSIVTPVCSRLRLTLHAYKRITGRFQGQSAPNSSFLEGLYSVNFDLQPLQKATKPTCQMALQLFEKFCLTRSPIQAETTKPASIPERPTCRGRCPCGNRQQRKRCADCEPNGRDHAQQHG